MRTTEHFFRTRGLWSGLALVIALGLPPTADGSEPTPAARIVETLHHVLAEHLRPPVRAFDARLERLRPVVAGSFDFESITRFALGPAYEGLDEAARARFTEMMSRLSLLTYADRFTVSETASKFVTASERAARRGRILVRTRLERGSSEPVTLDYVLVNTTAGPRIVNVLANGVSDLSLKRAEYAAVIRKEGVVGLEQRLMGQLEALAAQASRNGGNQVTIKGTSS